MGKSFEYIFNSHSLKFEEIEHCTPGTNAVFKIGWFIAKIFAPIESGMNTNSDYRTELFGIERANKLEISAPQLVASGIVEELFSFEKPYMDGYFGEYDAGKLAEKCFNGLLLHDFGYNIIRCNMGCIDEITSLAVLKERLYTAIKNNKRWKLE